MKYLRSPTRLYTILICALFCIFTYSSQTNATGGALYIENGKISTYYTEDFLNNQGGYAHTISTDAGATYKLISTNEIGYISGAISLTGTLMSGDFHADIDVSTITPRDAGNSERPGSGAKDRHKVLVILINFLDSTTVPFSNSQAHDLIFKNQIDKFMKEQSYGKIDFEGDVFGRLTLNKSGTPGNCNVGNLQSELYAFAVQNNIDIRNYDHYLRVLNCPYSAAGGYSSIGGGGYVTLGGILSKTITESEVQISLDTALFPSVRTHSSLNLPFSRTNLDRLVSHELGGHALGVDHAQGRDCGSSVLTLPCTTVEYGNPFDTMGPGLDYALHLNGRYKEILGRFKPNEVLFVTNSGTYKLIPLEAGTGFASHLLDSKKVAYIVPYNAAYPAYVIEYRAPIGFDAQLSQSNTSGERVGLYINKLNSYIWQNVDISNTQLIDTHPNSANWYEDVSDTALNAGDVFTDPKSGITITPTSTSQQGELIFDVDITPTGCIYENPYISPSTINFTLHAGNSFGLISYITNTDYSECDPSDISIYLPSNPILQNTALQTAKNVVPGTQFDSVLSTKIKSDVTPGQYQFQTIVTNHISGRTTTTTYNVTIN